MVAKTPKQISRYAKLAMRMAAERREFHLTEVYKAVCNPPHADGLTNRELHSRCARGIGNTKRVLIDMGFVIALGERKNSYIAVRAKKEES